MEHHRASARNLNTCVLLPVRPSFEAPRHALGRYEHTIVRGPLEEVAGPDTTTTRLVVRDGVYRQFGGFGGAVMQTEVLA